MSEEHKLILLDMVFDRVMLCRPIPRGCSKSALALMLSNYNEAVRRTNYILAAIDEKYVESN